MTASVFAFLLAALLPIRSYANSANELADVINTWDHGGDVFEPLEATSDGKTVTVTGDIYGVEGGLFLDIDAGVTVVWEASLEGMSYSSSSASPFVLVRASGGGVFEMAGESAIAAGGDYSMAIESTGVIINVTGGEVYSEGNHCASISAKSGGEVNILGGDIYALGRGCDAITADSRGGRIKVHVLEGLISARGDSCSALNASFGTELIVNGGEIDSFGTPCAAIKAAHKGTTVTVSGGKISVSDTADSPETAAIVANNGAVCDITGGTIVGHVIESSEPSDTAVGGGAEGGGGGCGVGAGLLPGIALVVFGAFRKRRA
jgi:hypothetical protein